MRDGSTSTQRIAAPAMRRGERLRPAHAAEAGGQDRPAGQGRLAEVLLRRGRERLVGALEDSLRADVDPRPGRHLAEHRQPLRLEPAELVPRRPARHEQRVRDQHARRLRRRPEDRDGLAGLNEQGLVVAELQQCADDSLQCVVRARRAPRASVDHEVFRPFGDFGVEVVEQHPQRRLGCPRLRVQCRAARCADRGEVAAERFDGRVDRRRHRHCWSSARCSRSFEWKRKIVHPVATTKKMTATAAARATPPPGQPRDDHEHDRETGIDEDRVAVRVLGRRRLRHAPLQTTCHSSSPISASTVASSEPSRIASATASISGPSGRSSRSRGRQRPHVCVSRARAGAGLERREELDGLRRSEQLDRERSLGVGDHLPRLQARGVAHRHVVLLAGARRDRVHRRRMAQRLVLRHERGRHVLRDHEAGVEPAVGGEERRQAVAEVRVDEPLDATLRDVRQLGDRHRERVERERERLAVEVAGRDEQLVLDEHERVVGRRVQLGRDGVLDVVEQVARRSVHLRRAAQRVRVLHLVAPAVRLHDRRAFEQAQHVSRRRALPSQRPQRMHLRQERRA